jgi:thiol-disulfide isomerase/thioredoxin
MVRLKIIALALLSAATAMILQSGNAGQPPAETEVKLVVVNQQDYLKAMKGLVGKIVVVDVWGEFCPPCKAEFPHLVELHEKYAKKGVACVSLSLDLPENKDDALKFLQKQKAGFTNLLLDERSKVWQDHFSILGPPAVFVYDKAGKLAGRFNEMEKVYTYDDVERLVERLIDR